MTASLPSLRAEAVHKHKVPFHHRTRRYHYHPAALGRVSDDAEATERGARLFDAILLGAVFPLAALFFPRFLDGYEQIVRFLNTAGPDPLIPWLF